LDTCGVNNADASVGAVARLGLDRDLYVLAECSEETHEALTGEVGKPTVPQGRHLWLIDAHERSSGDLSQAAALDDLPDMACKLRLGQLFLGLGEAEIGEHVAAARRHGDFGFSLLDHCS
jgi:hypothetical protein